MGPRRLDGRARTLTIAVVAALSAAILLHPFPPQNDASSHGATAWVLERLLAGDAFVAEHYRFDATPLPYWLPTLLGAPLVAAVGPLLAYRLLCVLVLALTALAAWRLSPLESRVLAPLGALAGASWAFWRGEIAFMLGVPLALLAFDALLRAPRMRSRPFALFVSLALATYLSHLFALATLAALVGVVWLRRIARGLPRGAFDAGLGLSASLVGVAAWFVLLGHGSDANQGRLVFDPSLARLVQLVTWPLDLPGQGPWPALGVAALVAGGFTLSWRTPAPERLLPAAALALMAWLGPAGLEEPMGYEDIGERFTLGAFLVGLGAFRLPMEGRTRGALLAAVLLFAGWRVHGVWQVHADYQPRAERIAGLLEAVPEESRLLPLLDVEVEDRQTWLYHRFGNWALPLRRAYSPHLFARTGQQPLKHRHRAEYRPVAQLELSEEEWASFDHLLIQSDRAEPRVPGLGERAERVGEAEGFSLWRVRR